MIEKRHFTRIAFDASARLTRGENDWPAKLLDISLKGALLQQPEDSALEKDDPVSLYLLLSDEETEIRMEGHVAHLENNHVGIACDHMDVDSASHLRRIVELNTGNEALLEREIEALVNFAAH
ncbi:MAG: PilZ domain-containing protein [Pseudomonadota bacterium]|nr:PilZ domain-containing protein [Pseudomonadota bacterium]